MVLNAARDVVDFVHNTMESLNDESYRGWPPPRGHPSHGGDP